MTESVLIWSLMSVIGVAILGVIGFFVYITWFDDRLRVIIIDSKSGIKITKVKTKFDNRFSLDKMTYTIDKEAVYRRFFKIPYSFYFINNPNPIKFDKERKKTGVTSYTSQELHDLLEVNYTLNLIKPNVNVKKIVMGTAILIGIAIVAGLILHFTGVIDIQTLMLQESAVSAGK